VSWTVAAAHEPDPIEYRASFSVTTAVVAAAAIAAGAECPAAVVVLAHYATASCEEVKEA